MKKVRFWAGNCFMLGVAYGQALHSYCKGISHGPVSAAILNAELPVGLRGCKIYLL